MDPTANLAEQLHLAQCLEECGCADGTNLLCEDCTARAIRLAGLVLALHEWIVGGGFLPTQWPTPTREARCAQLWTAPSGFPMRCSKSASHTGKCTFERA